MHRPNMKTTPGGNLNILHCVSFIKQLASTFAIIK